MEWMYLIIIGLIFIGGAVTLYIGAAVAIAVQARWRGYSLALWLASGLVSLNPVIFLVVLALMPNRARRRLRETFRAELEEKLAARSGILGPARGHIAAPALGASTLPERSLGDMPTVAPPERSLGDEVTRG
jgi:hypothetical protein